MSQHKDEQARFEYMVDHGEHGVNHHFYISKGISAPHHYSELCHILRTVPTENDVVYLHLNCPGGNLDSTLQIANALAGCAAETVGVLDGSIASAATMLFLACDSHIIYPLGYMLCHNYTAGAYDKGSGLLAAAKFLDRSGRATMEHFYTDFLTKAEIADICDNDRELYLDHEEIHERLSKLSELKLQRMQKEQEEQRLEAYLALKAEFEPDEDEEDVG